MPGDCATKISENPRFDETVAEALRRMREAVLNPPSYEVARSRGEITVRRTSLQSGQRRPS
jgi:hypothetical protein